MNDKKTPGARLIKGVLQTVVFAVGLTLFLKLTHGLLKGQITYSVGEIDAVTVTTSGFWDTLSIYLTFSPICIGLMIVGVAPALYIRHPWLIKVLLGTCAVSYVWSSIVA